MSPFQLITISVSIIFHVTFFFPSFIFLKVDLFSTPAPLLNRGRNKEEDLNLTGANQTKTKSVSWEEDGDDRLAEGPDRDTPTPPTLLVFISLLELRK